MERVAAAGPNDGWSMDFMSDELFDGRRIRLLTIVDNFTRESLATEVGDHIGGHRVVESLMQLGQERGLPRTIRVDDGPEFMKKGASPMLAILTLQVVQFPGAGQGCRVKTP